jgi:Aminopeptidase P, N-terminal domain
MSRSHRLEALACLWKVLVHVQCPLVQGGGPAHFFNTDGEAVFRQESYFFYLFGVQEPDFFGAIDARSVRPFACRHTLLCPRFLSKGFQGFT